MHDWKDSPHSRLVWDQDADLPFQEGDVTVRITSGKQQKWTLVDKKQKVDCENTVSSSGRGQMQTQD